jgi:c(7)-type cytochrome triheme protein
MIRLTEGMLLVVAVFIFVSGNAMAIQPGKTVTWDTPMGKVVFDGKVHADAKVQCLECHSKIFKMKKGSTVMKMADINSGKFCGNCHNGKRTFASNDKDNCGICHKK